MNSDESPLPAPRTSGVVVNSRRELEEYLSQYPRQLRAARPSRAPRVGHPDFVGPVQPEALNRPGAIPHGANGCVLFFALRKRPEDEARDAALLAWGIEL